jgi:hypothetical protein
MSTETDTGQLKSTMRKTNAQLFDKLEAMNVRLKNVEQTTVEMAAHSVRCEEKWAQYHREQLERASNRYSAVARTQGAAEIANTRQVAVVAGVVAIVVAIINLASFVLVGLL